MIKWLRSESFTAWAFMTPGLLLLAVFVFWPIIYSIPLALTDYSVISDTHYVGLANFEAAFKDRNFLISIWNSLVYVLIVPFLQVLSILMAVLVNSRIPAIKIFRTTYYIPVVTSMVAVALIWSWLLGNNSVVNYLLIKVGLISKDIHWLSDSNLALYVLMFITLWKGLGYYMMLYLAGLQNIPQDLYEAARVDGAGRCRLIVHITLPLLRPYILFCTLISLMAAIRVFDEVYVLTKGGPGTATLTSSLYIFRKGMEQFNFGYASALGLIVGAVIAVLSIIVFRFNRKGGVNPY
ncbi:carbohydrate ABC transporter permease [Paenibacillus farraposensis]|jgi:putative chitobiose transport system permease protein|uniref:Carbohydrate ABC transporter permease n=1 Tax=Paenibacillus farraposensis TaxID=2807095 RepID=A0ABW4DK72_9BACL|nr:sugar ABC transporter permease [Paenibacillus farraposensis]MCC3380535.1 sugar ABC transporter permease [Paenibacillus farraposensis]